MAASGKRNFTDRFPATKSTRGRSHHDPFLSLNLASVGWPVLLPLPTFAFHEGEQAQSSKPKQDELPSPVVASAGHTKQGVALLEPPPTHCPALRCSPGAKCAPQVLRLRRRPIPSAPSTPNAASANVPGSGTLLSCCEKRWSKPNNVAVSVASAAQTRMSLVT